MAKKRRKSMREHLLGLIIVGGVCAGAAAFVAGISVNPASQLAVGNAADLQCIGGPDAKCPCHTGFKKGTSQCDGKTPGGGKIQCPCKDVTSGHETDGKCATVGKCKGEKTDGMMPMLPMLPMPMPKMSMPMMMMPQPCVPKTASSTSATSTNSWGVADPTGGVVRSPGGSDPNCPPTDAGAQNTGGFWGNAWNAVNPFSSPDDTTKDDTATEEETTTTGGTTSVWGNLMKSLGLSNDSGSEENAEEESQTQTTGSSTAGQIKPATGTSTTPTQQATIDFATTETTFTYQAPIQEQEAATLLDQLAKILRNLLAIVNSWLKK